jgi:hypothetical protein
MIKAVAQQLQGTASLGMCRVQVDVAETAWWLPAHAILETRMVEAVVSLAFVKYPSAVRLGDEITVVVALTHPDSSIDHQFTVYLSGCGGGDAGEAGPDRHVTFRYKVEGLSDQDISNRHCTLVASTSTRGTIHVVGSGNVDETIDVVA